MSENKRRIWSALRELCFGTLIRTVCTLTVVALIIFFPPLQALVAHGVHYVIDYLSSRILAILILVGIGAAIIYNPKR